MNDTPGWASPGSDPSDGAPRPAEPNDAAPGDEAAPTGSGAQWSKEQPPAGQWSAPGSSGGPGGPPPPAGPGPGRGGGPTWGGHPGWGGPPPAAKPGVIPLRPLGVGEILDGAVSTMRTYWRTVLGISLGVAVLTEVLVTLVQGFFLGSGNPAAPRGSDATVDQLVDEMNAALTDSAVLLLFALLGTILATALLTMVTSRAILGRSVTIGEAWQDARPQLLRLFGLTFLLPLLAVVVILLGATPGLLLLAGGSTQPGAALTALGGLAGLVVAVWLIIRFSLASPALMLEKQSIRKALGRSAKLVKGSWWRVFGIQLLAGIITNVVAAIILFPASLVAGVVAGGDANTLLGSTTGDVGWTYLIITGIGAVIGSTITLPISAGVTVLLYTDLRIRREALDVDLARAAATSGPASPAPGTTSEG